MKIKVPDINGYLPDKYSKYAKQEEKYKENPCISFPIEIKEKPGETKSLALTFIDFDAVQVCGFPWIHWTACNIPRDLDYLLENMSTDNILNIVQGKNSFASFFVGEKDENITMKYAGPTPPDKEHLYTLTVYALDTILDLKNGYYLNDFYKKIKGHVLSKASIEILGRY